MRILHIMGMRSTKLGGLERFMLALLKSNPENSHFFVYNEMPLSSTYVKGIGIENLRVMNADLGGVRKLILNFGRVIKEIRPDIVHFHFGNAYGLLTVYAKLMGVKMIFKTEHSCWFQNRKQVYNFKDLSLKAKIYTGWGYVYRLMDAVLPVSLAVSNQMKSIFGSKINLKPIYLGVEDVGYVRELSKQRKFTISSVSFASPIKGADVLINALSILKRYDLQLILIGLNEKVDYTRRLHELAKELGVEHQIIWVGITDDVAQWLLRSDVYVQASRTEALSLAAVEALSLGIPVIGSQVGGLPEVSIKTFPVEDYYTLSKIIESYVTCHSKLVEDSKAAREKYEGMFKLQKAVSSYNGVYQSR